MFSNRVFGLSFGIFWKFSTRFKNILCIQNLWYELQTTKLYKFTLYYFDTFLDYDGDDFINDTDVLSVLKNLTKNELRYWYYQIKKTYIISLNALNKFVKINVLCTINVFSNDEQQKIVHKIIEVIC